jgi:hypothetical protein
VIKRILSLAPETNSTTGLAFWALACTGAAIGLFMMIYSAGDVSFSLPMRIAMSLLVTIFLGGGPLIAIAVGSILKLIKK